MSKVRPVVVLLAITIILLASTSDLFAQATRTWVSGVGDDANPCSRTAPCKTFAGAISKTAAGGIISVLDPGGYGAVTITKSMTIDATGSFGSVLVSGTNGIVINAASTDVVFLKGLQIHGLGTGINGVRFLAGESLFVEDCTIYGFTDAGISFEPGTGADAKLFVKNTTLSGNISQSARAPSGIFISPADGTTARAFIERTMLEKNGFGLFAEGHSFVSIAHSGISGNERNGIRTEMNAQANVDDCTISNNTRGIVVNGATSIIRMNNSAVVYNNVGLSIAGLGGQIVSLGNNEIRGNPFGDGAPTSTVPLQ